MLDALSRPGVHVGDPFQFEGNGRIPGFQDLEPRKITNCLMITTLSSYSVPRLGRVISDLTESHWRYLCQEAALP